MAKIQILNNAATTQNSLNFRINFAGVAGYYADYPQLEIYGNTGTATFDLKYKASDGNFYSTGDSIAAPCLYILPFTSNTVLRLDYTAGGGSSISAAVSNGSLE